VRNRLLMLALAGLVAGCAAQTGQQRPQAGAAARPAGPPPAVVTVPADPYPSTYRPLPSRPMLIRGARVYDGKGGELANASILVRDGRIAAIGERVAAPRDAELVDATGLWVTPGIIDVHSHLGDYPTPAVAAHQDGNEITGPVRSEVWAEHSVWPQDPGFTRALMNGGVTTLHILPGSANLFGGRGVTLRNLPQQTVQAMRFPGAPHSLKMACGENPKRVYGSRNQMPGSRMANVALMRQTWARAQEYKRRWDDYAARAKDGRAKPTDAPARDLQLETLVGVLEGRILVQNHCYRSDEMAIMLDMAREFGFRIAAFHHAVESYKIADLLAREGVCSAMWADWYGFKMESLDGIKENIPMVHAAGACAVTHSDDAGGIQRLNQETAKALAAGRRAGLRISNGEAWAWIGINAARALGIEKEVGSLEPGKRADLVLWNADPLSIYARPMRVWMDGALVFDAAEPRRRPVSDFELGQPGEGDAK
jgi:imidazolonepropionase-like amidohydrolase